ncbi:MAG: hypothetical protein A3D31_13345 [Candidatus Fluviicola riflensis]|nr:MAG: hypothetical protein CHH17_17780 [Candidatus Fluviicola riflensis]OGS77964.1 MAG: hypothetical protein A3D31_13345 [Candidatus Fluviicola riflensis]OGS85029.1 MAG: hypothetical protein A2724_10280 [Fluviicola sp. RIFCSPHIGHO2_01_FULL_43_53]OGS89301.1 MAG: hypothetical protein A3E30_04585 [Fluviicola sp. RIFCSPHIGHO2_12_FULL_43_24]
MKTGILLLCCCFIGTTFGQSRWTNQSIGLSYGRGAAIHEYSNFIYTVKEFEHLLALDWTRNSYGKSKWEELFNYPDLGVSVQYSSLGNDQVYGRELAIFPYTRLHLLHDRKWDLVFQFGIGLSYVNRKYDGVNNPDNVAIGSHFNIHFNSQFLITANPFPKWMLFTGIAFDHLSNGNLAEPNLGFNSFHLKFGTSHRFGKTTQRVHHPELKAFPAHRFSILPNIGWKRTRAFAGDYFFAASFTGDYHFFIGKRFITSAGADFFYDSSVPTEMKAIGKSFKQSNYFQTGIHLSQVLRYKKAVFGFQAGVYLGFTEAVSNRPVYTRALAEYHFSDRFFVRLAMKSHFNVLDFPELGVGFKWKNHAP